MLLCQRESVAPTASRVDFDSDSLPFIPAFRESGPVEKDRSISRVDAHPTSFALGVFNVSCYRDKRHNKTLQRDCQPARCGSLVLVHGFRLVDGCFTRWQPLSFGRSAAPMRPSKSQDIPCCASLSSSLAPFAGRVPPFVDTEPAASYRPTAKRRRPPRRQSREWQPNETLHPTRHLSGVRDRRELMEGYSDSWRAVELFALCGGAVMSSDAWPPPAPHRPAAADSSITSAGCTPPEPLRRSRGLWGRGTADMDSAR